MITFSIIEAAYVPGLYMLSDHSNLPLVAEIKTSFIYLACPLQVGVQQLQMSPLTESRCCPQPGECTGRTSGLRLQHKSVRVQDGVNTPLKKKKKLRYDYFFYERDNVRQSDVIRC